MKSTPELRRRFNSFKYAFKGIAFAFRTQANMRIHGVIFLLALAAGFYFNISTFEWLVIIAVSGLVFSTEVLNTAFEYFLDKYYPDYSINTGRIKDLAAGAVLIAAMAAAAAGLIIFLPKLIRIL